MTNILESLAKKVDKVTNKKTVASKKTSVQKTTKVNKNKPSTEKTATTLMDNLLAKNLFHFPQIGDTITGRVIDVSSNEIYLDLNPFGTGVVLGKEMKNGLDSKKLKAGDEVVATIMELENEDNYIELSIREASCEKAWDDIESKRDTQEKVKTKILGANKGGLLAEVNGISGFLPVSQLASQNYPRVEDGDKNKILNLLKKLIGQELEVCIIDADKETEKLIVSEKAAQSEKNKEIISTFAVGDIVSGEVSGVVDFGAFVKFTLSGDKEKAEKESLEGLVHISELAWQLIEDPRSIIKIGDKVKAKIIGIDNSKISLSIRALQKDPWSEVEKKYTVGDVVSGTVNKVNHFGAFIYLDKDIHGLAHISEMSEAYPGKTLDELIKAGEVYNWKILSIEPKSHRMGLVLVNEKESKVTKKAKTNQKAVTKDTTEKSKPKVAKEKAEKVKKETKKTKGKIETSPQEEKTKKTKKIVKTVKKAKK